MILQKGGHMGKKSLAKGFMHVTMVEVVLHPMSALAKMVILDLIVRHPFVGIAKFMVVS
jgi:hypothetical protein